MTLGVYADLFDSDLDHVSTAIDNAVEECGQEERLKPLLLQRVQPIKMFPLNRHKTVGSRGTNASGPP
jgi:hypothetical protein